MEIWQIVIIVLIDVILLAGAGLAIALPTIRSHHQAKHPETETRPDEVVSLPKQEETPAQPAESEPAPAPVEHTAQEKARIEAQKTPEQREAETENAIAVLFGGRENIIALEARGSRVTIQVKDTTLIRSADFDRAGLKGAMIMSDRIVFPVGANAAEFAENLRAKIGL